MERTGPKWLTITVVLVSKPQHSFRLRHAHAIHSLDRGAPIHLVQQTLGHASVATTGRYLSAEISVSSRRAGPPRVRCHAKDHLADVLKSLATLPKNEGGRISWESSESWSVAPSR